MMLKKRIYEDFFKKSRLDEYRKVLKCALENEYKMVGVWEFYRMLSNGECTGKILLNRHDIDTSPKVARKMFGIEKEVYGNRGSVTYYFRDSTIDCSLIHELEEYGYETGYHYEEIALYEKRKKLKNRDNIVSVFPEIRKQFTKDLSRFREDTSSKSLSVASHGDFINTMYDLQNYELLRDDNLLREHNKIVLEAYDEAIMKYVQCRYADQILLERFSEEVIDAINKDVKVIMILTHPRNWEVDLWANTKENFKRFFEGLRYKF